MQAQRGSPSQRIPLSVLVGARGVIFVHAKIPGLIEAWDEKF
jgi:hypothetical protein